MIMKRSERINYLSLVCAIVFVFFVGLWSFNILFPLKYKNLIEKYAGQENLSASFVASIIKAESNFNADAVSNKGAVGLMQLMPKTAKWIYENNGGNEFKEAMLLDPETNIYIGTKYLAYLFSKHQDEVTVLACYNAGEGAVSNWLNGGEALEKTQIEYGETRNYVSKVQNYQKIYKFRI